MKAARERVRMKENNERTLVKVRVRRIEAGMKTKTPDTRKKELSLILKPTVTSIIILVPLNIRNLDW